MAFCHSSCQLWAASRARNTLSSTSFRGMRKSVSTTLYAYQKTGQATTLSLMGFFHFLPLILLSPLAGALVDRYPRKWAMLAADLGGGLATGFLLLLYLLGRL